MAIRKKDDIAKKQAFSMTLSRGVIIAFEKTTAIEIAKIMTENNIGAVLIMKGPRLVGIVSERDIVRRVVSMGLSAQNTQAKDFMTTKVITAQFKDGLNSIYQQLCKVKFRHLPIMDGKRLVGIASQRDVLYHIKLKKK